MLDYNWVLTEDRLPDISESDTNIKMLVSIPGTEDHYENGRYAGDNKWIVEQSHQDKSNDSSSTTIKEYNTKDIKCWRYINEWEARGEPTPFFVGTGYQDDYVYYPNKYHDPNVQIEFEKKLAADKKAKKYKYYTDNGWISVEDNPHPEIIKELGRSRFVEVHCTNRDDHWACYKSNDYFDFWWVTGFLRTKPDELRVDPEDEETYDTEICDPSFIEFWRYPPEDLNMSYIQKKYDRSMEWLDDRYV